ncbi:hypothetical protein [Paenibacillus xylanexedens]|uniref:Uncharacterized protein n=1 Tax=Paenibacillus xylanexedens TaxID=528191 RepID=A0ABS4RMF5_PAEXY|nr:hypothetical protein [Paenibacillus xylanexedens]MBP2243904.1 hypothetical protein [Paenibacillus xylanexedens]
MQHIIYGMHSAMMNQSDEEVEFLVISNPGTRGDRIELDSM